VNSGFFWGANSDSVYQIMRPEHRAHTWVIHEKPRCAECQVCGDTIGAKHGEEMNAPFYGCTVIEVR